jgi:uncharacterized protein (DUF2236 family)
VDGQLWTAASWLFDWVLNRIVDDAEVDQYVAVMVREIVDEHLGWFSLRDLDPADRSIVRSWLADRLVEDADAKLPAELAERDDVLLYLADLTRLAIKSRADPSLDD